MALFNDLFTESVDNVAENVASDYLKDLPLAKFAEDASFLDCGSKGLVLAEAGWTDICETINNMSALDEALDDVADKAKDMAGKAGAKIKAGGAKVKEFLKKVPEYLKKIAQNIFGTINKFLTSLAALVKNDQNILDAAAAKEGLKRYNAANKDGLKIKGFLFDGGVEKAANSFKAGIDRGNKFVKEMYDIASSLDTRSFGKEITASAADSAIAEMRKVLVGNEPANGAVTSKSFIVDMKATYGKKDKDGAAVTDAILDSAVSVVKGGYKDGQKAARSLYKDSKEQINKWIENCDKLQKSYEKSYSNDKDSNLNWDQAAKAAQIMGNTMMKCAGLMSSYTGAYCQLLHQNYSSLRGALVTCVGYSKGGKAGKKVYGESDTSIFGLDLV